MSTRRQVQVLPDSVADQIAAGEVVERPASVVKELVENSLDARAQSVDILIERGGKRRIRVIDDGSGMIREDAMSALGRHATSKIRVAEDLHRITSFGFRGEALPSIAAVSRLSLETRESSDDIGTSLRVSGGKILGIDEIARRTGTSVEVENLFFNAPARSKFLKSVPAESRAVSDVVISLSLANPSIAFKLVSDGRVLLELPSARDLSARIAAIWGAEEAAKLLAIRGEGTGFSMRGLVQRPDAARPGFRRAHFYVNGRPFRMLPLIRAADRGYRTTISERDRPWLFLYFEAPDGSVDVNVHPAKAEVRFRDQAAVEELVEEVVRQGLVPEGSGATFDTQLTPPSLRVRESPPPSDVEEAAQMALFVSGREDMAESQGVVAELESTRPRLFQIHNTYILAETREGLLIIDQHSAHERVLFQELMAAFEGQSGVGQRLLFPLTLRLTAPEYALVEELQGMFARAGFEVEGFGGDTVLVQGVPVPHPYFDAERCFREMVSELTEGSELTRSAHNQHERIAMTFACKGAIKAGQRLDQREMEELFERLFATELPFHDVHGRPTIVRLSSAELERKFGR